MALPPAEQAARVLHVANGHAVTDLLAQSGIPGTRSIWADALHEGPVPDGITDEALVEVRAHHLSAPGRTAGDVSAELRRWRDSVDRLKEFQELVLWYEHDLFDQLNLVQVLDRIAGLSRGATEVSLVSVGSFPGHTWFEGMGELTADELASLFDNRQPVGEPQFTAARAAWRAFRSPDPRALEALLATDLSALPFIAAALRRHLEEFPSVANGLSRSEQHLLALVSSDGSDLWALFPMMHDGEACFYIADLSFWAVVRGLTEASPPLLEISIASQGAATTLPRGTATLTAAGRAVLIGESDRIRQCGIDRWLGGTHVTTESTWRWDGAKGRIVPPVNDVGSTQSSG
ncbi:MAG: hypothetical protein ABI818_16960 [Acidobacteriota bacterium]